jgi:ribosomal protein S18 acetylase RimI-like enzyme
MVKPSTIIISPLSVKDCLDSLHQLGELLRACVVGGANIGFVLPFSTKDAESFWQENILGVVEGGKHLMLVARSDEKIVGTVQLDWNTMPNQPHRAEIKKLMVHPDFRRMGIAQQLMTYLEVKPGFRA